MSRTQATGATPKVTETKSVSKTESSGKLMKRSRTSSTSDKSKVSSTAKTPKLSVQKSVSTKSVEGLKKDESKIKDGTLNVGKWQKVGNFFLNIGTWFQNQGIKKEHSNIDSHNSAVFAVRDGNKAVVQSALDDLGISDFKPFMKPNPHTEGTKEHKQFSELKTSFDKHVVNIFSDENTVGYELMQNMIDKIEGSIKHPPTHTAPTLDEARELHTTLFSTGVGQYDACLNTGWGAQQTFSGVIQSEESFNPGDLKIALESNQKGLKSNLRDTFIKFKTLDKFCDVFEQTPDSLIKLQDDRKLPPIKQKGPLLGYKPWKIWKD